MIHVDGPNAYVVAPNRRGRPNDFRSTETPRCPFCPGNEADTEPTIWSDGEPWTMRAVANKYPMLDAETARHEVIVESPAHVDPWEMRGAAAVERLLHGLALAEERVAAHPRAQTAIVWKNAGPRAGASLRHPHCQAISLPYHADAWHDVGPRARARLADDERERGVASGEHVAVIVPAMPRVTYELNLVPRVPATRLADWSDATFGAMAAGLVDAFARLVAVSGTDFDHNILFNAGCVAVLPRRRYQSGIELAAGVIEVDVPPGEAAEVLRLENSPIRA